MISDIACRDAALEQAEATLHRSSKLTALGQLAGEVAHDLNNLLTVLSGQLEKEADRDRRQRSRQNIRGQHRKDDGEAERR
jgi:signal transduction histidine kinase